MIEAEPVEQLVCQGVLARLASPALVDAMAGKKRGDGQGEKIAAEVQQDQQQLDELAGMFASREISAPEWRTARQIIEARLTGNRRRLAQHAEVDALSSLNLASPDLSEQFAGLDLSRQAQIVAAILDHAVIGPGTPGARRVDPSRVIPVWRL